MPEQLWETTMDPERRLLKQLVVEDAAEANVVFSSLMGARVRKTLGFLFFYLTFSHIHYIIGYLTSEEFMFNQFIQNH